MAISRNQFIALRDQVEAEVADRQAGLLEQAKAEKEAEQVKKKTKEDLFESVLGSLATGR